MGSVYVCAYLSKKRVTIEVVKDEETAESNTIEALKYLFMKKVHTQYSESNFSHASGKKSLTESEKLMKLEFDSFVKECVCGITVANATDRKSVV